MNRRASWLPLAACGVVVASMGLYFAMLRPPLLREDIRYLAASPDQLVAAAPRLSIWLRHVFWVLGGYQFATGVLLTYVSMTSFRKATPGSFWVAGTAGAASIAWMAVVNWLIDSDFKWPVTALAGLWSMAVVSFRRQDAIQTLTLAISKENKE